MVGLFTDPAKILEPGNRHCSNLTGTQDIRAKTCSLLRVQGARAKTCSAALSKEQYCIKLLLSHLFSRQRYASSRS